MVLRVQVTKEGTLRIVSPEWSPGEEFLLQTHTQLLTDSGKGQWSKIKAVLNQVDTSAFPRKNHDEILRDLHEMRGEA